jgi:site-specific recombinase
MKMFFLRAWAIWRRFRRGSPAKRQLQYASQVESLMCRANPFAAWHERVNWIADVAEWLRHEPRSPQREDGAWRRARHQRTRYLLDWLDAHRDVRRLVRTALQKTLREAVGPELFAGAGMPAQPAFLGALWERIARLALPRPPARRDLTALLLALFPERADAEWLLGLDAPTLSRLWRLVADDGISHACLQQIDEALLLLMATVLATGLSPEFQARLLPRMPVRASPFMALRRELERYLASSPNDAAALRGVRMLIAVCAAQTDKIYADLDEHGVSLDLVYHLERMRAQLTRMSRLIDVRSASEGEGAAQSLLGELLRLHHAQNATLAGLPTRGFSLLARKLVERHARHGDIGIARDAAQYRGMLRSGVIGGGVCAALLLAHRLFPDVAHPQFFDGLFAAANLGLAFLLISALGGVLAARQPAVTAPALAARMGALDTSDGLRALHAEVAMLLRSQAAAVFGNLLGLAPALLAGAGLAWLFGASLVDAQGAREEIGALSLVGPTPLYAIFTGVLIWLAAVVASLADNWFALRRMREALASHRRLVYALGSLRARRFAAWAERHVAQVAGNLALALLFGLAPAVAHFFGLPIELRHVTLAAGRLLIAAGAIGWRIVLEPAFWLALAGVLAAGLFNVATAFGCALWLALQARGLPTPARRRVLRAVLRRFLAAPSAWLLPRRGEPPAVARRVQVDEEGESRRRRGQGAESR